MPTALGNTSQDAAYGNISAVSPNAEAMDWHLLGMTWHSIAKEAIETLASTSASFLVHETPLTTANQLPTFVTTPVTPTWKHSHRLLEQEPENDFECAYQGALQLLLACENQAKAALVGMQSTVVLQSLFCGRLSNQLVAQEDKQKEQKKRRGKLVGDGLPRLLTGDEFYSRVVEFEREERAEEMAVWKVAEVEHRERNKARKLAYKVELTTWEVERDAAKLLRWQPCWKQPKLGKLEPPLPKPVFESVEREEVDGNKDNGDKGESEGAVDD
ncbi:hypothetical protein EDC04DRAFT_2892503 [Pisolithus marmoratus]|nr:hypothetical protein EDC04DRAFT_2892503 [Pisolithus marmoratus]